MRVLVTGAAGFIGCHVARSLVERGADVYALVRPGTNRAGLHDLDGRLTLVEGDLDDTTDLARTVDRVRPEAAVHLAWYVEPRRYLHAVPENLGALEASVRLLRLLAESGCGRLVVAGTSFERCAGRDGPAVDPPQRSAYAACKEALHQALEALATDGVAAACAHIFYVFGPWERPERLVPTMVRALLRGEEVEVTDGRQVRDYLDVRDAADALCTILDAGVTGSVDVSAGTPIELADLFAAVGDATGRPDLIRAGARPYGDAEVVRAVGDPRVLRELGWAPASTLTERMHETVAWWKERLAPAGSAGAARTGTT